MASIVAELYILSTTEIENQSVVVVLTSFQTTGNLKMSNLLLEKELRNVTQSRSSCL